LAAKVVLPARNRVISSVSRFHKNAIAFNQEQVIYRVKSLQKETFLAQENWYGSYYELAIEYYPVGNDESLLKAVQAIWESPYLSGPWFEETSFGNSADMLQSLENEGGHLLYGLLQVEKNIEVGCLICLVREEEGSDWLDFCIPTGMLELVFNVEYPLLIDNNPWMLGVDQILLDIAKKAYRRSPFELAIIGEEVSGYVVANDITLEYLEQGGYIVPQKLLQRLRPTCPSVTLDENLQWFPFSG